MPFNINDFRSSINGSNEIAKADKFDVVIAIPPSLPSGVLDGATFSLRCESAELPGVTINPIEFINYGFVQKIPGTLSFPPVNLVLICTASFMQEKFFFDYWANQLISFDTGLLTYIDESQLKTTVSINQYDMGGNQIYQVDLLEAFPIDIQAIPLSWSNDQFNRLSVTFAYKKWRSWGAPEESNAVFNSPGGFNNSQQPAPASPTSTTPTTPTTATSPTDPFVGGGGTFGGGGASSGW